MKEHFNRTVVICAAASSFFGGAFVLGRDVMSFMDSRVVAVQAAQAQQNSSAVNADANSR
jgi:hypothetical protein